MRVLVRMVCVAAALALQGCGGLPTKTDANLASLPLFEANGQPRFTVDLACAGQNSTAAVQCSTVDSTFADWSGDRHVELKTVSKTDPAFKANTMGLPQAMVPTEPYLVAIRVQTSVVASYFSSGGGDMGGSGSYYQPGSAGYLAWIRVFSVKTGALVRQMKLRRTQTVPDHANVTPVVKTEIQHLIRSFDPSYSG